MERSYPAKVRIQRIRNDVGVNRHARVVCPLTSARRYDRIAQAIDQVRAGGMTNITAGLQAASDLLPTGPVCQVILISDGHHNTGPPPREVGTALQDRAVIECVGIGGSPGDVDEDLLKTIASSYPDGSKRYRWIGDKERLVRHFHDLAGRITRA